MSIPTENFHHYIELAPNFFVDMGVCLQSNPCQHRVKIDGKYNTWYSVMIRKYIEENDLLMPEHFRGVTRSGRRET